MDDEYAMECPMCGEIALVEVGELEYLAAFLGLVTAISYKCSECGHEETM